MSPEAIRLTAIIEHEFEVSTRLAGLLDKGWMATHVDFGLIEITEPPAFPGAEPGPTYLFVVPEAPGKCYLVALDDAAVRGPDRTAEGYMIQSDETEIKLDIPSDPDHRLALGAETIARGIAAAVKRRERELHS